MKKILFLAFTPLLFSSCTNDFYDGDTRTIIEGKVVYNNVPLSNAEVNFYPVYNKPKNGTITELSSNEIVYDQYQDEPISISKTTTDASGKISISIPRNEDTSVYVVKVTRGKNSKYYGYISHYNTNNYYINLGTLNY
ncbi:DUF4198 domain-containing protein [Paenimyroides baculatum]|uniref:DUF4198 domain-containing protein n=1 Tax=Paenimyroides baculatum TaxID=2608000 RepID=A0A5M6CQ90_9FLAO|nr:DUF4198 domain-containing protein [Paenimyroides baculatum]KAA5535289.1 DUF4198 domain-containing protein [Paenimyroides baculatum]